MLYGVILLLKQTSLGALDNLDCILNIMKCNTCGLKENIPFRCNYCRQSFCHLHRIPINHSCPYIDKYTEKRRLIADDNFDGSVSVSSFSNNIGRALLRAIKIKSSKTELLHLFVATLLVTCVGLSFNHYRHHLTHG